MVALSGSVFQSDLDRQSRLRNIFPPDVVEWKCMRSRLNAGNIDLFQLFDVRQHIAKLSRKLSFLLGREGDAREMSDAVNIEFGGVGHKSVEPDALRFLFSDLIGRRFQHLVLNLLKYGVHFVVGERAIGGAEYERECQALLPFWQALPFVDIEHLHAFERERVCYFCTNNFCHCVAYFLRSRPGIEYESEFL